MKKDRSFVRSFFLSFKSPIDFVVSLRKKNMISYHIILLISWLNMSLFSVKSCSDHKLVGLWVATRHEIGGEIDSQRGEALQILELFLLSSGFGGHLVFDPQPLQLQLASRLFDLQLLLSRRSLLILLQLQIQHNLRLSLLLFFEHQLGARPNSLVLSILKRLSSSVSLERHSMNSDSYLLRKRQRFSIGLQVIQYFRWCLELWEGRLRYRQNDVARNRMSDVSDRILEEMRDVMSENNYSPHSIPFTLVCSSIVSISFSSK